jgi:hypothetical protein
MYGDLMQVHIAGAEAWQEKIVKLEAEALRKASTQQRGRLRRRDSDLDPAYIAKTILSENFHYSQAVANRNGHQQQAIMYGLAALVYKS